ncbi:MAG: PASTA domain-containing protein [Bacteroidales bacterium]|nr:PASTA domain-containing protein [Bacteroidales bacterium]
MDSALKRLLKHMAVFATIVGVLIVAALLSLKSYTHHNDVIAVPDVQTLTPEQAAVFLEKKGLRYKVVDSVYVKSKLKGSIIDQKPAAGSTVKKNRIVFLTINARASETVNLPDVRDFSQRQAVATLEGLEIRVAGIDYVPSEYRDLVMDVRYNGHSIKPGFNLNKGTSVTLVVGQGAGSVELVTPDLTGLDMAQAIDAVHAQSLNLGDVHYDVTPENADDAKRYKIYRQDPMAGLPTTMGKKVAVWMTTDETLIQTESDDAEGLFIE